MTPLQRRQQEQVRSFIRANQRRPKFVQYPAYLGQVAGQCRPCCFFANGTTELSTRSRHILRSPVLALQVAYPNFMIDAPGGTFEEVGSGGAALVTAALETRTGGNLGSFRWNDVPSVEIADGAMSALSDPLPCNLLPGEIFMRQFLENDGTGTVVNGITGNLRNNSDTANGEMFRYSTGAVDQTTGTGLMTGGLTSAAYSYTPSLIVATTTAGSALIIGTSRSWGLSDAYFGTSGDVGQLARSLGQMYGYSNYGVPGHAAVGMVASHTNVAAMGEYFTDIFCELGTNDAANFSRNAAQILADLKSIAGYYPGKRFHQCTISPRASSTDGFIKPENQTPHATYPVISALNTSIRALPAEFTGGICDIASILEFPTNSGKLITHPTANFYTPDGTHDKTAANLLIQSSHVVRI